MADWTTPFELSFLDHDLLIHIPTQEAAEELAGILDQCDVTWPAGERIPGATSWYVHEESTAWEYTSDERTNGCIRRGTIFNVDRMDKHRRTMRCTFLGNILDDVDIPNDVSLF